MYPLKAPDKQYNSSILASKEYYAINLLDDTEYQDKILHERWDELMGGEAKTTLIVSNRGKTIKMFENKYHRAQLFNWGLSNYNAFGLLSSSLLRPKDEIFIPVYETFKRVTDSDPKLLKIGIQVGWCYLRVMWLCAAH
jgi:hypothetical protein